VTAVILGDLIFGDFPKWLTWIGSAVIVGSDLYVLYCERHDGRQIAPLLAQP